MKYRTVPDGGSRGLLESRYIQKVCKYDLQPEKEHSTGEYLDNATKTEPDSIPNAQGYF